MITVIVSPLNSPKLPLPLYQHRRPMAGVIGKLCMGAQGCFLKVAAAITAQCSYLVTHVAGTRPHSSVDRGGAAREGGDVSAFLR